MVQRRYNLIAVIYSESATRAEIVLDIYNNQGLLVLVWHDWTNSSPGGLKVKARPLKFWNCSVGARPSSAAPVEQKFASSNTRKLFSRSAVGPGHHPRSDVRAF